MKKTIGCFTEDKLRELAEQPNVTVMQPVHDNIYTPWTASRVMQCTDTIISMTKRQFTREAMRHDKEVDEFASKYITFFDKLSDAAFVEDEENVTVVKKLILLRQMVDQGLLAETEAQAQSSDIALKSLVQRVNKQ